VARAATDAVCELEWACGPKPTARMKRLHTSARAKATDPFAFVSYCIGHAHTLASADATSASIAEIAVAATVVSPPKPSAPNIGISRLWRDDAAVQR
jgi:hypothetical protein